MFDFVFESLELRGDEIFVRMKDNPTLIRAADLEDSKFKVCVMALQQEVRLQNTETNMSNVFDVAQRIVDGWPPWKKNILAHSSSPTVSVARPIIVRDKGF